MVAEGSTSPLVGVGLVVGSVMTVALGVTVALTVLHDEADPSSVPVLEALVAEPGLSFLHAQGRPLLVAAVQLEVTVAGEPVNLPLADHEALLGPLWEAGEIVCVAGTGPGCIHPIVAQEVNAVTVFEEGRALAAWYAEDRGLPVYEEDRWGGDLGLADLSVSGIALDEDETVRFTATLSNHGGPAGDPFVVQFYVDGALHSEHRIAHVAPEAAIQVMSAPWVLATGEHVVTVVVDPDDAVPETEESNNEAGLGFTV